MKVKDYTIYAYARHLRLFSCHTCCDKVPRFLLSHPQDLPTLIDILQRTFLTQIPTGTHASEANQVNIFGSVELGTASKNHFLIKAETQTTRNMKYSWPAIQTQASCGECKPHPKTNILCNVSFRVFQPPLWLMWIDHLSRMQRVECSHPGCNGPKQLKQVVCNS